MKKGIPFCWGNEQERARREIMEHLTSEPVLAIYNPGLPIEVHTDASSIGYGAVLLQVRVRSQERSRLLQQADTRRGAGIPLLRTGDFGNGKGLTTL